MRGSLYEEQASALFLHIPLGCMECLPDLLARQPVASVSVSDILPPREFPAADADARRIFQGIWASSERSVYAPPSQPDCPLLHSGSPQQPDRFHSRHTHDGHGRDTRGIRARESEVPSQERVSL